MQDITNLFNFFVWHNDRDGTCIDNGMLNAISKHHIHPLMQPLILHKLTPLESHVLSQFESKYQHFGEDYIVIIKAKKKWTKDLLASSFYFLVVPQCHNIGLQDYHEDDPPDKEEELEYQENQEEKIKDCEELQEREKYKKLKDPNEDFATHSLKELNSISSNESLASKRDEEITEDKVFEERIIFGPLSKADYMEKAEAIILEIEENSHETPIDLCQIMTNGCRTARNELKGLMVFQKLKKSRIEPLIINLGYRSHLYTKHGKVSKLLGARKDTKACGMEHEQKEKEDQQKDKDNLRQVEKITGDEVKEELEQQEEES
eukprot:Gb_28262 [translate_table: standard]